MNPENYASLEMCKKLVEAGIVLETDAVWVTEGFAPYLLPRQECYGIMIMAPAVSMSEVWRELIDYGLCSDGARWWLCNEDWETSKEVVDTNPTDALCELLLWIRQKT